MLHTDKIYIYRKLLNAKRFWVIIKFGYSHLKKESTFHINTYVNGKETRFVILFPTIHKNGTANWIKMQIIRRSNFFSLFVKIVLFSNQILSIIKKIALNLNIGFINRRKIIFYLLTLYSVVFSCDKKVQVRGDSGLVRKLIVNVLKKLWCLQKWVRILYRR